MALLILLCALSGPKSARRADKASGSVAGGSGASHPHTYPPGAPPPHPAPRRRGSGGVPRVDMCTAGTRASGRRRRGRDGAARPFFEAGPGRSSRDGAREAVGSPLALSSGGRRSGPPRVQASRPTGRRNAGSAACRAPAKGRAWLGRQRSSWSRWERRGRVLAMKRASWAAGPSWTPWARSAAAWRAATRSRTCSRAWRPARRPA